MDHNVALGILRGLWGQGLKDVEVMPEIFDAFRDGLTTLTRYQPEEPAYESGYLMFKNMRVWPLGRMPASQRGGQG